ncbi:MAG: ABC transporter permease [Burkholderiaceae bacterium]|nr:ABC transporter permease [Burkholderiaceae bacterium]MDO9088995.1 ABC transporter permease [Burkholderiaceae bacterium]
MNTLLRSMAPLSNAYLILQMTRRDILGRYKGSVLGLGWSMLYPLLLLATYTFVFRLIFKARWPGMEDHPGTFALNIFAGLVLFNLFAEVVGRAPRLVLEQPNLVKRVIFPLEVLPWIGVGGAMFHAALSLVVLLAGVFYLQGVPPLSALAVPLILLCMLPVLLCLGWLLAAFGVFLRDIGQMVAPVLNVLLFLTPVLYPASSLPAALQPWLVVNPLALPIESLRACLLLGQWPHWGALAFYALVWTALAALAAAVFERLRPSFADQL